MVFQPAFVFMPKRTRCWKQAESEFERGQSSTVIRMTTNPHGYESARLTIDPRCPCLTCTVKIAQVGISEVVYSQGYNMDSDVSEDMIYDDLW